MRKSQGIRSLIGERGSGGGAIVPFNSMFSPSGAFPSMAMVAVVVAPTKPAVVAVVELCTIKLPLATELVPNATL